MANPGKGGSMANAWCEEELKSVDLNDKRLDERFGYILEAFANRPQASIPAAVGGGRPEIKAAYDFMDNEKVTPEKILTPHFHATVKRCQSQKVVLCPQDTSDLDFTRPKQQVRGAGPFDDGSRRGAFLHLSEAFTEDGTPLGAVWAKIWAREDTQGDHPKPSPAEKRKKRRATPIEEKESMRWIEGIRATQKLAEACPETTCVSLCDSEADIYDLLVEPRKTANFHWIVRACQERAVLDENGETLGVIRDSLQNRPALFTFEVAVRDREQWISCETRSRRTTRVGRQAKVEARAGTVTIKAPEINRHPTRSVTINVVWVREIDPPEDDNPIEWILLTTLPISIVEQVQRVIQYYKIRWMIEIYFRTLKSGCRIEDRRFETLPRMLACTAIYMIVAWRTLFVCRLGRSCPDMPCDVIFDTSEWQSVWTVHHRGRRVPLPDRPPSLVTMVRLTAILGGYVDRPNRSDPPGVETVWKGLQRMYDLAWGWETFGPGAS